jgi:hypothetical protein
VVISMPMNEPHFDHNCRCLCNGTHCHPARPDTLNHGLHHALHHVHCVAGHDGAHQVIETALQLYIL